tara:strand:+ start:192 stop:974 length:783 start_codon:yes stop_codon:yes gene_type:complete
MVNNTKITALIQARMGSSRLPGKVMKTIQKKPMLWHVKNRLSIIKEIDSLAIATTTLVEDKPIFEMAKKNKILCFAGEEKDVLKRFYDIAVKLKSDYIIRITADCPFVDPEIISELIKYFFTKKFDYCGIACGAGVSNKKNIFKYPDGLDAEIFSMTSLSDANKYAISNIEREHVTPYIWQNITKYKIGSLHPIDADYSNYRWTVDYKEDFDFVKKVYDSLYPQMPLFKFKDILEFLKKNHLLAKNEFLIGREGYEEFSK